MTIYADILVITNLYIDFFLLWCVRRFLHLRISNGRLVLGALAGAACALSSLLPIQSRLLSLLIGIAAALATAAAAFAPVRLWMFWKATICFWVFSFLLAGFLLFVIHFFAPGNMAVLGNAVYFDLSPLLLFGFTCAAYVVFFLLQKLFPKESSGTRYCGITVEDQGKTVRLLAKADTGNALREPFSGLPVLVCEADSLREIAPGPALEFLSSGKAEGMLRLVPFESMGGTGVLPAFKAEKTFVSKSGAPLECYLAICRQKLSAGQFNALYNPDLFPEPNKFT